MELAIPAAAFSAIERGDGSVIINIPEHIIRQAYCDLVMAEVETNKRRSPQPRKVLSS